MIVDMPPFYDGNGNSIEGDDEFPEVDEFEDLIAEFTGVAVVRDDREVFIILMIKMILTKRLAKREAIHKQ